MFALHLYSLFYWVPITSIFCFADIGFSSWMQLLHLKLIKSFEHEVAPFGKKWEVYKLIRIIAFSYLSKMVQFLSL